MIQFNPISPWSTRIYPYCDPEPSGAPGDVISIRFRIAWQDYEGWQADVFPFGVTINGGYYSLDTPPQYKGFNHEQIGIVQETDCTLVDSGNTVVTGAGFTELWQWREYTWDLDTGTVAPPAGLPAWQSGRYELCLDVNGKHASDGATDNLYMAWGFPKFEPGYFLLTPEPKIVEDQLPDRVDLHARAAGERATYWDEFLTKNQLEQGEGITLRYRDDVGDLRNPDGSNALDSNYLPIATDAEHRQKIRIDGCGLNVGAFAVDIVTRVGCWGLIVFDHNAKTHLGFTADINGTSSQIGIEYSSYLRIAVNGDLPVDYETGLSFGYWNNYRFEGLDFQNPTHTLDADNKPIGYDTEIVFQFSYGDQNTDPLAWSDIYGPDYSPGTADSRIGDAAPRAKIRAYAKTTGPSARTQHAVHVAQQPAGYPAAQNPNPIVQVYGGTNEVMMMPWDVRATILHQREYGTFPGFPLSTILDNVWLMPPESGCWDFNVHIAGVHGNQGFPYPFMRYEVHLVALIKDGDTPALIGWPDQSLFLQHLDQYQWMDQVHVPAIDDGPSLTPLDSVPWSVQGSLRVRIDTTSNQNAVGFALVLGYPQNAPVLDPAAGYRTFDVSYAYVDLQKVHDDYGSYYTALTDPPYPNTTANDVRFMTIHP